MKTTKKKIWQALPPLLIGQAPAARGEGRALEGICGLKLSSFASMSTSEFYAATERRNLFDEFQGKAANGKGDAFDETAARSRAMLMLRELDGRVVVYVGRKVADAFGLNAPFFRWCVCIPRPSFDVFTMHVGAVIPHPSGISHAYNEQHARDQAGEVLRAAIAASKIEDVVERVEFFAHMTAIGRDGRPC
jgi:hypothetical protein